jgi:hypothetical protein
VLMNELSAWKKNFFGSMRKRVTRTRETPSPPAHDYLTGLSVVD